MTVPISLYISVLSYYIFDGGGGCIFLSKNVLFHFHHEPDVVQNFFWRGCGGGGGVLHIFIFIVSLCRFARRLLSVLKEEFFTGICFSDGNCPTLPSPSKIPSSCFQLKENWHWNFIFPQMVHFGETINRKQVFDTI